MSSRLRQPRLQRKPKRVHMEQLSVRVKLSKQQEQEFADLVERIQSGTRVPDSFYRHGIDATPDELLEADGIMHLHLGGPNSREVVFLVQYEDDVMILEISDHYHFETDPIGTVLRTLHQRKIEQLETQIAHAKITQAEQQRRLLNESLARSGLKRSPPSSDP